MQSNHEGQINVDDPQTYAQIRQMEQLDQYNTHYGQSKFPVSGINISKVKPSNVVDTEGNLFLNNLSKLELNKFFLISDDNKKLAFAQNAVTSTVNLERLESFAPDKLKKYFCVPGYEIKFLHYCHLYNTLLKLNKAILKSGDIKEFIEVKEKNISIDFKDSNQGKSSDVDVFNHSVDKICFNMNNCIEMFKKKIGVYGKQGGNEDSNLSIRKTLNSRQDNKKTLEPWMNETFMGNQGPRLKSVKRDKEETPNWEVYRDNSLLYWKLPIDDALVNGAILTTLKWEDLIDKANLIVADIKTILASLDAENNLSNTLVAINLFINQNLKTMERDKNEEFLYCRDKHNLNEISNTEQNSNLDLSYKNDQHKKAYDHLMDILVQARICILQINLILNHQLIDNDEKIEETENLDLLDDLEQAYTVFVKGENKLREDTPETNSGSGDTYLEWDPKQNDDWKNRSLKVLKEDSEAAIKVLKIQKTILNKDENFKFNEQDAADFEQKKKELIEKYELVKKQIMDQHTTYKNEHLNGFEKFGHSIRGWFSSSACCGGNQPKGTSIASSSNMPSQEEFNQKNKQQGTI